MKITRYILPLLAVMAATASCDRDSNSGPEEPVHTGNLDFDVMTTSGADTTGTVTTENIPDFRAYAYKAEGNREIIMDGAFVHRTGKNSWVYDDPVKWPDTPVNIEAVYPTSYKISVSQWDFWSSVQYSVTRTVDGKQVSGADQDLCVAVRRDATRDEGIIRLNFRHCMARVQLDIAADIPLTTVVVKGIDLYDVAGSGTFMLPKESTTDRTDTDQFKNCWYHHLSNRYQIVPYFQSGDGQEVPLTTLPARLCTGNNYFYIPIPFEPVKENNGYIAGTAIRVLCKLIRTEDGQRIWPNQFTPYQLLGPGGLNSGYAYIYFPLLDERLDHSEWLPGYDYHYTVRILKQGTLPTSGDTRGERKNELSVKVSEY